MVASLQSCFTENWVEETGEVLVPRRFKLLAVGYQPDHAAVVRACKEQDGKESKRPVDEDLPGSGRSRWRSKPPDQCTFLQHPLPSKLSASAATYFFVCSTHKTSCLGAFRHERRCGKLSCMADAYTNNHYVPVWYQRRFLPQGQQNEELFRLDLAPEIYRDATGKVRGVANPVRRLGFDHCFAEDHLYRTQLGVTDPTVIERLFFGVIDSSGRHAVQYFGVFTHPYNSKGALQAILEYMSTQKLRTPKGLQWLAEQARTQTHEAVLGLMVRLRQLHCAIWTECVWQIADARASATKFIISDHPVTVYNRRCGPRSQWCRGVNDPDIRCHATHTVFPLSLDKVLILTNLSWVRNPYQSETDLRPNPSMLRNAMFDVRDIQTERRLSEQEVREINFIIKSRALRYVAAANKEWLYPEQHVSKSNWNTFGHGYLLMPDPRPLHLGGELMIGFNDGSVTGFDEYGRRPWEDDYAQESRTQSEQRSLYRFKGEFARLFGPSRRGRSMALSQLDPEVDDPEYHQHHLDFERKHRRS